MYIGVMNISIVSTTHNQCTQISVQSNGASQYVYDGWYAIDIFGGYRLESIDEAGNNIYAKIQGMALFIVKDVHNHWVVSTIP